MPEPQLRLCAATGKWLVVAYRSQWAFADEQVAQAFFDDLLDIEMRENGKVRVSGVPYSVDFDSIRRHR